MKFNWSEFTKEQKIFVSAILSITVFAALVLAGVIPGRRSFDGKTEIVVWGMDAESDAWFKIANRFENKNPGVSVTYKRISPANYESELINALAAGRGPDVAMFGNRWLSKHGDKISPIDPKKFSADTLKTLFPKVVEQDFISGGKVYAIPTSIDTLALVYNRDIFDTKQVPLPPKTWSEFESAVPRLRTLKSGSVSLAGASIGGTSVSVPNAADILSTIMMQNGSNIVDEQYGYVSLSEQENIDALEFYARFADPKSGVYTWENSFKPSVDSFKDGRVAMIFAYADEINEMEELSKVDFAISPFPQANAENPVVPAKYWGLAVFARSEKADIAEDFVIFAATDEESASIYAEETGRPPALRFLISKYADDRKLGVFAGQALIARSWKQPDESTTKRIFDTMISEVVSGGASARATLSKAETELRNIIRK